jgi:hypothetical protein
VFVLDASTSVTEPNFEIMKGFVKFFLANANIDSGDVRVGLITFSDNHTIHFHLDAHMSKVWDSISLSGPAMTA